MAILDSIKDPQTGQIKKPILYSLIGGGALLVFLLLKGKGSAVPGLASTGQTTPLTPDLTGLQDAIKNLTGSGIAGSGSAGSTTTVTNYTGSATNVAGSSGAGGGGGGGTGQVIHPIAKSPSVYAGLTTQQAVAQVTAQKQAIVGKGALEKDPTGGGSIITAAKTYISPNTAPKYAPSGFTSIGKHAIGTGPLATDSPTKAATTPTASQVITTKQQAVGKGALQ